MKNYQNQNQSVFNVLQELNRTQFEDYKPINVTKHLSEERINRYKLYEASNNFLGGFIVDKEHYNGNEVHLIDDQGFIHIYNEKSKRFITILSGRPSQIKRYYRQLGLKIPRSIHIASSISHNRNEKTNANNF